jgi:6,7-dimethyl-8-ribityllumazine synthase
MFGIAVSRYNSAITENLLAAAVQVFDEKKLPTQVFFAPGCYELPLLANKLALTKKYQGIVCLGAVIQGDTAHFEFISGSVALGIMGSMLLTQIPITFGVLTTYTEEQAMERSRLNSLESKGREAALACIELAHVLSQI